MCGCTIAASLFEISPIKVVEAIEYYVPKITTDI